jgi:radical SAM protein with 4Fe4S-binding SPASM domain
VIKLPKVLAAELTYKCNHRCIFCSCPWEADKDIIGDEMEAEEWGRLLTKLKNYGVEHITFTGGEPTLRKDIFEILDCAKMLGYTLGLITNGQGLDDSFLQRLKPYDILLSISVPGIETFADTTKNDNINEVLNSFSKCKEIGIKTVANIAVTKKNLWELYENIALPIINGADYILLNRFLPGGRGLDNKQFLLTVDEMNEMFDIAEEVLTRAGIKGHIGTELPYCIIKDPTRYKNLNIGSLCGAAKQFFVIDPSGYIKVCNHSPKRVCKWNEIDNLSSNAYWQAFIETDYIPNMCRECKYLKSKCDGGCREAAHVFHGEIDDADPCFEPVT